MIVKFIINLISTSLISNTELKHSVTNLHTKCLIFQFQKELKYEKINMLRILEMFTNLTAFIIVPMGEVFLAQQELKNNL